MCVYDRVPPSAARPHALPLQDSIYPTTHTLPPPQDSIYASSKAGGGGGELRVRDVTRDDFDAALAQVRPSVSPSELAAFEEWNKAFGSFANQAAKRQATGAGA